MEDAARRMDACRRMCFLDLLRMRQFEPYRVIYKSPEIAVISGLLLF